jgi:anti-sigma factor ChrR (cupin superfamily)
MTPDPYRDEAAAYAAGALEEPERSAFEAHLAGGCSACEEELAGHERALLELSRALPAGALDPALRRQTLDLAEAPAMPIDVSAYTWDEVVPGVRVHVMKDDPERGMRACLVWADPGAVHPRHRHTGDEVILVLQGGIKDENGSYGPGEICRSRPGSVHSEQALPGEECICYVLYHGELVPVEG